MTTQATSFNRLAPKERHSILLATAIKLAEKPGGLGNLQRGPVAAKAGCSASLINHYFGDLEGLRQAVVKKGIQDQNLAIISQAVIARLPLARKLDAALKQRAIAHASA